MTDLILDVKNSEDVQFIGWSGNKT
jgi:hypothetical protein